MPYLSSSAVASTSDKLQCGELGSYGEQLKRRGKGKYHRDHIPSKAALLERARQLNRGRRLTRRQAAAIVKQAQSVVIPAPAHKGISPTYGGRNANLIESDADNLAGAAKRDTAKMSKNIHEHADPKCVKHYKQAAAEINKMTNEDYDAFLLNIIRPA